MSYTTNPKAQQKMKDRETTARKQRENDIRCIMSQPEGRRFVWWLVNVECESVSTVLGASSTTLHEREGMRSVGARMLQRAQEICPREYVTMVSEAIAAQAEDTLYRKDAQATEDE